MIPLNLKTNRGRCAPLALQQAQDLSGIVIPDDSQAALLYSRPPLAERACCSGDDSDSETAPQFSVEDGAPTPPPIPDFTHPISALNLKSASGRCSPLAINPAAMSMVEVDNSMVEISYTRPPLRERACCSGDDEDVGIQVVYSVISECRYIALEDELGFIALEDESGYFALECAF